MYGLHAQHEDLIEWITIAPGIADVLRAAERQGVIRRTGEWRGGDRPSERRFHRAFWLCAGRGRLGGLLRRARPSVELLMEVDDGDDDGDGDTVMRMEMEDGDEAVRREFEDVEPRNDDCGLGEEDARRAWRWVREAVQDREKVKVKEEEGKEKKKEDEALVRRKAEEEEEHRVLWCSEWGSEEVVKGGGSEWWEVERNLRLDGGRVTVSVCSRDAFYMANAV